MSSNFRVQNLFATQETLTGDLVFDKTSGDVTLTVTDQVNATLTVPDVGGVSQDILLSVATQNVENKTIKTSTIETTTEFGDSTDNTKQLAVDLTGATTATKTTLDFNQTANRTVTFPDATGTVGLFANAGTDNRIVRMDGTDKVQDSGIELTDTNDLNSVRSIGGETGQNLTLTSATGQSLVLTSDTNVSVTNAASVGGTLTLASTLVFDKATNDLTVAVTDQATGVATATIPDLGGVSQDFVLTSQTQELTNKTLASSSIKTSTEFVDSTDTTKQVAIDLASATTGTTTTLDFNQTANRTIAFPDVTGTVAIQPSGTDNQLLRMDGTSASQASTVTLGDAGELAGVLSIAGSTGNDLTLTAPTGQSLVLTSDTNVSITNNATVGGKLVVTGDLEVNGTTTSVNSSVVTISDNNLLLSSNYTTATARSGGLTVNYLPTATTDTLDTGGFTSTSTVATVAASTFSAGDIILITGANNDKNNGLFEVLTHAANVLTIASTATFNFLQDTFVADSSTLGSIRKVTVAALQAGTDGRFEVAQGSSTSGMTFTDLALVTELGGVWTELTHTTTNNTPYTLVTHTPTANKSSVIEVVYTARQQSSVNSNCGTVERTFYKDGTTVYAMGTGMLSNGNFGGNSADWLVEILPSSGTVLVRITGDAANSVDWKIRWRYLQSQ